MRNYFSINMAGKGKVGGTTGDGPERLQRLRQKPEAPKSRPGAGKGEGKKGVAPRRAPARGKYIDEYARPGA